MNHKSENGESFIYRVYGLTLCSNRKLPGLTPIDQILPVDVFINLKNEDNPPSANVENVSNGLNIRKTEKGFIHHLWFRGDGQLDFEIDEEGKNISVSWNLSVLEEVLGLLLGPVLGCVLRLREILCLHGSVVEIDGRAVIIVGPSGAGKSTMAAAFALRGHPILSDDIAVLKRRDNQYYLQPGYPRLRLWPETVQAIYGSESNLEKIFSFSEKRFFDLKSETNEKQWKFQKNPLPLGAIYILGDRRTDVSVPQIESIAPAVSILLLLKNRSAGHFKLNLKKNKKAREFANLSHIAKTFPLRRIIRNDQLSNLPQLYDVIREDFSEISFG